MTTAIPTQRLDIEAIKAMPGRSGSGCTNTRYGKDSSECDDVLERIENGLDQRVNFHDTLLYPENSVKAPISRQDAVGMMVRDLNFAISYLGEMAGKYDFAQEAKTQKREVKRRLQRALEQLSVLDSDEEGSPELDAYFAARPLEPREVLPIGVVDARYPNKLPTLDE